MRTQSISTNCNSRLCILEYLGPNNTIFSRPFIPYQYAGTTREVFLGGYYKSSNIRAEIWVVVKVNGNGNTTLYGSDSGCLYLNSSTNTYNDGYIRLYYLDPI